MKINSLLFVPCFFMISTLLLGQEAEIPTPGKQIVQSIELPASTSVWNWKPGQARGVEEMEKIGEPRPLDESKTDTLRYWLFLPTDYETQAQSDGAPLLLFLHGAGERGNESGEEIAKVKVHGPPRLLDTPEFAKKFPCVTVSPQCKNGYAWSPAQLMLLLDHIEKNHKINKNRVYVTGLSMGGFGTWMCLNESPKRFAAAAPICGGAKPEWAEKLTGTPIWTFHGDKDFLVTLNRTANIVEAIKKAGGKKILFTIYEGVGHDSWTQTYDNPLLYDWMFQQSSEGGSSMVQESIIEKQIGDGKSFKVKTIRNEATETFSVTIHVTIQKANAKQFENRYKACEIEITDRVTAILHASSPAERMESGLLTIKEKIKRSINDVLGTPWVLNVLCSNITYEVQ